MECYIENRYFLFEHSRTFLFDIQYPIFVARRQLHGESYCTSITAKLYNFQSRDLHQETVTKLIDKIKNESFVFFVCQYTRVRNITLASIAREDQFPHSSNRTSYRYVRRLRQPPARILLIRSLITNVS